MNRRIYLKKFKTVVKKEGPVRHYSQNGKQVLLFLVDICRKNVTLYDFFLRWFQG